MLASANASSTPCGSGQNVVDGQHRAPGGAEQDHALQAEGAAHLAEFADEPLDGPKGEVVGAVGLPGAELVVEDHAPVARQSLDREQESMAESGAAMEDQDGRFRAVADRPSVDLPAVYLDVFIGHALFWGAISSHGGSFPTIPLRCEKAVKADAGCPVAR